MGADNMASPEARQGISAFSAVGTPPRPGERTTVLPRPDVKPVPVSPQPEKQPPKAKKPWIQRMIGNLGVRIGLGVLAVGGAGYVARETISNNIPSLSRPAETVAPFDNAKLDTERQTIVFGKNAREATPEDIQSTVEGPRPKIVDSRSIKSVEDIPTISLIPSIGQDAGTVKIYRASSPVGMNGKSVDVPMNLRVSVENDGTRFGPVIPEGINTNEGELFIRKGLSREIDGKLYFTVMWEVFKFENDQYVIIEFANNAPNSLLATDFLKNAPFIDTNKPKSGDWIVDLQQETGLKFNILDNPALFIKTAPEDINIHVTVTDNKLKGSAMLPEPKVTSSSFLMNPPR